MGRSDKNRWGQLWLTGTYWGNPRGAYKDLPLQPKRTLDKEPNAILEGKGIRCLIMLILLRLYEEFFFLFQLNKWINFLLALQMGINKVTVLGWPWGRYRQLFLHPDLDFCGHSSHHHGDTWDAGYYRVLASELLSLFHWFHFHHLSTWHCHDHGHLD